MQNIIIMKANECDDMTILFQGTVNFNPDLDATILFNALIEHLPGGTMTELYRQFVKNARMFDAAAPNLLAVAEKADELVQELMELANLAIAAAKGEK